MKTTPNIETLLTQAPYITIQQLFQESSVDQITNVHKFLQENIRSQGIGLKKIFESKYMDLVNCSQLLENVNKFALKVDQLALQIKGNISTGQQEDSSIKKSQDKIVQKVEGLVRKNQFAKAIRQCLADKSKEPILFEVVLLETVETAIHKILLKTTEKGLFDILQALTLFVHYQGQNYLTVQNVEQEYGDSFAILSKHYKKMSKKSIRSYLLTCINSLFQIKIKQSSIQKGGIQFLNFIQDLLSMISLIQSGFNKIDIKLENVQNGQIELLLTDVEQSYKKNFDRIKNSLSKQMISSKDKRILFNFDFYNAMLADDNLIEKFELLERKLSSTGTIAQVLGRLWSDFYHQFIEYVLNQLNTFEWVYHQVSGLMQEKLVFIQFKRHLKDNFAVNMLAQGRKYKETAHLFLTEISNLIKLCSKQDGEALLNHFRTQMKIYLQENVNNFTQLFQSLSDNNQRLKTCMVTLVFQTYFIGNVLQLDSHQIMRSIIEDSQIKIQQALKTVLIQYAQNIPFHQNIERMFEDLQEVCMPLVVYLKQREQKQSFKIFILWLLQSIETTLEGKNKQKVNYTLSILLNKNTVSQHQSLLHFIPSVLFNITTGAQSHPFNADYYENLLQAQQSKRIVVEDRKDNLPQRSNRDLFDIGQSEPATSKNASQKLMALSSQFVGGLINRIRQ